jgi:hypothetical protein
MANYQRSMCSYLPVSLGLPELYCSGFMRPFASNYVHQAQLMRSVGYCSWHNQMLAQPVQRYRRWRPGQIAVWPNRRTALA